MKKHFTVVTAAIIAMFALSACQSTHESGVKSSYRTQWTKVAADPKKTTEAASAVLAQDGLKDITTSSTNIDGLVTGRKADGTKVKVSIQKQKDAGSEVSVNVGALGDPALGAELARKIKDRAER